LPEESAAFIDGLPVRRADGDVGDSLLFGIASLYECCVESWGLLRGVSMEVKELRKQVEALERKGR
jgi:hypothetical protein